MAKTANELLRDAAIRHAVGLEKLALSQVKDIVGLLNDVDLDLVKQINERLVLFEGSGRVLSKAETKRLDALLEAVRIANAEGYEAIYKAMVAQGQDLASYEAAWQTAAIDHAVASVSATANLDLIQPTAASLKAIVTEQPLQGRLLKDWVDGLKQSQAQRIEQQIRLGMVEGEGTDKIVRRIRGTKARKYKDGILEIGRRDCEGIVRTSVNHVSNAAREQLWDANSDIMSGVQIVATLDSRTSPQCRALDLKVYPVHEGPRPPFHIRCRTMIVAYLKGASIEGMRESEAGPVPATMTFGEWLRSQPRSVVEDALGKKKARLFLDGGLPIDRFVDDKGEALSLTELHRKEAAAFEKAGVTSSNYRRFSSVDQAEEWGRADNKTWAESLKQHESDALDIYKSEDYRAINSYLRGMDKPDDVSNELWEAAPSLSRDLAAAVKRGRIGEDITLWRGVNNKSGFIPADAKGKVLRDAGFMSASALKKVPDEYFAGEQVEVPVVIEMLVPKGTRGAYVHNIPDVQSEEFEVLFPPGVEYRVLDDTRAEGKRRLLVEVLK